MEIQSGLVAAFARINNMPEMIWVCSWLTQNVTNDGLRLKKGTHKTTGKWRVVCQMFRPPSEEERETLSQFQSERGHLAMSERASLMILSNLSRALMMVGGGQVRKR